MRPRPAILTSTRGPAFRGLWIAAALALAGCSKARPVVDGTPQCTTWNDDVVPALTANCISCHSGPTPEGGWDATSYLGAVGIREPARFAVAADAQSALLAVLRADAPEPAHRASPELQETLRLWVVDCALALNHGSVHEPGLLDPTSSDFHGKLVKDLGWDFPLCQRCHGDDFAGGKADASCHTCHEKGTTDCSTCHGDTGRYGKTGAHQAHLGGQSLKHPITCVECHVTPRLWDDPGHLLEADGTPVTHPAQVVLAGAAAQTPPGTSRAGPPAYDPVTKQCSNVYCHGATFVDIRATQSSPKWTDGAPAAACGACHGLPPQNHNGPIALGQCQLCHQGIVDVAGNLIAPERHLNGHVDVLSDITSCTSCHGTGANPAPPRDLDGRTTAASPAVGAHRSHLEGTHRLASPVACGDCHQVPAQVGDVGHLDSDRPAEVFPASIAADSLAFRDGATPAWDRATGTCSNVYCHGGGARLTADQSTGLTRQPGWTAVDTGIPACGTCHGIPPVDFLHNANLELQDCSGCHPSVDDFGVPIFTGPPGQQTSAHINGVIDVGP